MTWDDFYSRYFDWSENTVRSRISSLEDIGYGEEVVEVVLNLWDDKLKAQLIRKAMRLGVTFTHEDFINLKGELSDELYIEIANYGGFELELCEDNLENFHQTLRQAEAYVDQVLQQIENPPKKHRVGFWATLLGIGSGMSRKSKKSRGTHHTCNGDCDHCPPHYGYRYGRWYYGHGHQRGCEFGGNGGQRGKCYKS